MVATGSSYDEHDEGAVPMASPSTHVDGSRVQSEAPKRLSKRMLMGHNSEIIISSSSFDNKPDRGMNQNSGNYYSGNLPPCPMGDAAVSMMKSANSQQQYYSEQERGEGKDHPDDDSPMSALSGRDSELMVPKFMSHPAIGRGPLAHLPTFDDPMRTEPICSGSNYGADSCDDADSRPSPIIQSNNSQEPELFHSGQEFSFPSVGNSVTDTRVGTGLENLDLTLRGGGSNHPEEAFTAESTPVFRERSPDDINDNIPLNILNNIPNSRITQTIYENRILGSKDSSSTAGKSSSAVSPLDVGNASPRGMLESADSEPMQPKKLFMGTTSMNVNTSGDFSILRTESGGGLSSNENTTPMNLLLGESVSQWSAMSPAPSSSQMTVIPAAAMLPRSAELSEQPSYAATTITRGFQREQDEATTTSSSNNRERAYSHTQSRPNIQNTQILIKQHVPQQESKNVQNVENVNNSTDNNVENSTNNHHNNHHNNSNSNSNNRDYNYNSNLLMDRRLFSMARHHHRQTPYFDNYNYTVLVYHESMTALAKRIKSIYPKKIRLVHGLSWERFKDGWPNLTLTPHDVHKMQDELASVCFLGSFHVPEVIFEQLAIIYSLPKFMIRNYRIIVPWFATGTMERVETMGQIATAKTLAKMLDNIPHGRGGPPIITIYDIHALQEQFYFSDNVLVELKSAVFLLKQELVRKFGKIKKNNSSNSMVVNSGTPAKQVYNYSRSLQFQSDKDNTRDNNIRDNNRGDSSIILSVPRSFSQEPQEGPQEIIVNADGSVSEPNNEDIAGNFTGGISGNMINSSTSKGTKKTIDGTMSADCCGGTSCLAVVTPPTTKGYGTPNTSTTGNVSISTNNANVSSDNNGISISTTTSGPSSINKPIMDAVNNNSIRVFLENSFMSMTTNSKDNLAGNMTGGHDIILIGFPDDGAKKRFGLKFPEYSHVVMTKERIGDSRIVCIKDSDVPVIGKHVVIVDDLVQTGGTLLESMKALHQAGARKVSCFVTHGVFPNDSWRKFCTPEVMNYLDTFYICDTIPTTSKVLEEYGAPFKVLSIAPLVGYLLVGREPNAVMREQDKYDT